jgi:pimeloyl-ACP methyl ester carboxylesterase
MLRPHSSVNAIILDSGPALSIADTCTRFMDSFGILKVPSVFRGPILFRIIKASYVWATLTMLWVAWPPRLLQSPTKLLFIANENDAIIPPEEIQQIARLKLDAELWLAPQTSHLMAFRTHSEEYCKRVTGFLEKSLSSPE